jgi:hypothetical protein
MSNPWESAVRQYLTALRGAVATGDATEATHRPALKTLVESLVKAVNCVNEPKGSSAGRPDFKVLLGETPLGFIETKDIGANLIETQDTPQLKRYLANSGNLILTDYLDFRWFKKGLLSDTVRLAQLTPKGTIAAVPGADAQLHDLLINFLKADLITIASPKELAQRMAGLAKTVRKKIIEAFEDEAEVGELHTQLKAFREVLLPDLDVPKFADMYAQTICYGLFAAKCEPSTPPLLARDNAASYLPKTNPFLRKLFASIMAGDLNERVAFAIDGITFLLNHADIQAILQDFGKRTRKEDPVVHFYETFLAEYDSKLRKTRGVYYTPEPVVSFLVRSIDYILRHSFNKPLGLADPMVLALDPATGTATFHHTNIKLIYERFKEQGQYGQWSSYVRENLLPRLFGFELLMAPYAVAHLKLGLLLQQTGYDFSGDERLGIYLTNTLEEAAKKSDILFAQWISDESNAAAGIKRDKPIMVVFGNPPYSGHSANKGEWISNLIKSYYQVDGKSLGEKNSKWLQDDYVKFIRWGQWRIEKTGAGVLAFITNNGYLDNPTFRGMRQQLMQAFTDIYILDLHGSSKKKEKAPDGSKDENVFDIQQGVCIGIFVKEPGKSGPAQVHHAEVYGERESKYEFLLANDVASVSWVTLKPQTPFYLFVPQDVSARDEYERCWQITKVMPLNVLGFQTHRDHFAIDFDPDALRQRIAEMRAERLTDREFAEKYSVSDNRDWQLEVARCNLRADRDWERNLIECLYRPFDLRPCYFSETAMDYPRRELLDHVAGKRNLCLLTSRQQGKIGYRHCCVSREPPNDCVVSTSSREANQTFPLYLYHSASARKGLFDNSGDATTGRKPNLAPEFIAEIEEKLGLEFDPDLECGSLLPLSGRELAPGRQSASKLAHSTTFGPEDVFNYIYAIFHSPTYRKRYAEFLKIDFPRVPLTSDKGLFRKLCALGGELVALHLMESPELDKLVTTYPKKGNDTVENVRYLEPGLPLTSILSPQAGRGSKRDSLSGPGAGEGKGEVGERESNGCVCINRDQYFAGIRPEEWEFHIGGHQVLQKWLKDRKGRKLSADDLTHYQRIVIALRETIRLMAEIDQAIPKWPVE